MTDTILKDFLGVPQKKCQGWKCNRKAFRAWGGIVECREHYRRTLIKNYGSVKRAGKYVDIKGVTPGNWKSLV